MHLIRPDEHVARGREAGHRGRSACGDQPLLGTEAESSPSLSNSQRRGGRGRELEGRSVKVDRMIEAVHVVWVTAGLGCDGDTIAMTAASLPSIEELVAGALPGVPGCPVQPDNFTETLAYVLQQMAGNAPMIPLDELLRPRWLFTQTVHEGCDRGGYYEQADFAPDYASIKCIVKLGCWGPVVQCNVGKRGWMAGIGGCPNVGGVCIGCTMPGFPDKFMSFMDEPPGAKMSTAAVLTYGRTVRALRQFTMDSMNREPAWRRRPEGER